MTAGVPRRENAKGRGTFTHSVSAKDEVTTGKGEDNRFSGGSFGPTQISGKGRSGTDSKDRM